MKWNVRKGIAQVYITATNRYIKPNADGVMEGNDIEYATCQSMRLVVALHPDKGIVKGADNLMTANVGNEKVRADIDAACHTLDLKPKAAMVAILGDYDKTQVTPDQYAKVSAILTRVCAMDAKARKAAIKDLGNVSLEAPVATPEAPEAAAPAPADPAAQ
jgi:hypothetical protein